MWKNEATHRDLELFCVLQRFSNGQQWLQHKVCIHHFHDVMQFSVGCSSGLSQRGPIVQNLHEEAQVHNLE
jgi:hypothetical protein